MQPNDRAEFRQLLSDAMAFYRQDVSTFALSVWWQACQPFDMEQVRKALTAHAMDPERGQFAPKPADLIRQLQGTRTDRSLLAWGKAYDAIRTVGAYTSVVFDDGAIHAAISDMGGWPKFCRSTVEELPFLQKRFCDLHKAYSARPSIEYPPTLPGEHDLNNHALGYASKPPALVGDVDKARAVQALGSQSKTAVTFADAMPALEGPRSRA